MNLILKGVDASLYASNNDNLHGIAIEADGMDKYSSMVTLGVVDIQGNRVGPDATVPLEISGSTEKTKKGITRVMCKVSFPYIAYKVEDGETVIDSARSGGMVTAHLVLAVPGECATDLRDPTIRARVLDQVSVAPLILGTITKASNELQAVQDDSTGTDIIVPSFGVKDGAIVVNGYRQTPSNNSWMARGLSGMTPIVAGASYGYNGSHN